MHAPTIRPRLRGCAPEKPRNGFFTTYSLKVPFAQCVDVIGSDRVAIWANDPALPGVVMESLKTTNGAQPPFCLRTAMERRVEQSERAGIALACLILGKA